ncbi:MAG: T9SS type A sorting domain-containing protein [Bacteroidota bacterium]
MRKSVTFLSILIILISFVFTENKVEEAPVDSSVEKSNIPKLYSQRKSYVKGKLKKDSPNLFADYHRQIRTEIGAIKPKYSSNYRVEELDKALLRAPLRKKAGLDWISRGPGNVGGRSRGIIIDPDDSSANTWYIAAVGGGVWKTIDAGENWRELTSGIGSLSASYMAMAASNHNVIYLGTGEGFGNLDALGGQGMWKTTDRGNTWNQISSTASGSFGIINRIIVDPDNENILLAATSSHRYNSSNGSGIWKSTDGGQTWDKKYTTSKKVQQIICDPNDFSIQYASVNGYGIIKSTDSGESWELPAGGLKGSGRIEIAVSPVDTDKLFASVDADPPEVYKSTDKGETWKESSVNVDLLGGQGWYDNAIIADPYDEDIFYIAGVDIYRLEYNFTGSLSVTTLTNNYGADPSLRKGTHVDNHYFAVAKLDDNAEKYRLVGTNDGGVCYTDDNGETFTQPTDGFITSQFYGVDKANGKSRYIGGMQDNSCYLSPVNPTSNNAWDFVFGGDGFDVVWNYNDENKVMLTSQYNNIAITHSGIENLGSTAWIADVERGSDNAPFFTKLAQSKQYSDLVFTFSKDAVWRTEDFGKSWEEISMPTGFEGESSLTEIKVSLADPSIVWTGTSLQSSLPMYVSDNFGKSFTSATTSEYAKSKLSGFTTHPTDKNTAYALFSSSGNAKILRTSNLGKSWEDLSGFVGGTKGESLNGFPDVAVFDLLVMPYNTDIIWVGTEIGIIESRDNGVSWSYANTGMPPVSVYDMLIVNDEIVVGTHGRGVWSVSISELSGYEPPSVAMPLNLNATYYFEDSKQFSKINLGYRSSYDKVIVYVGEELKQEFNNVSEGSSQELLVEIESGNNQIRVVSIIDENEFENKASVVGLPLKPSAKSYLTNFEFLGPISDEFYGDGFNISQATGFDSKALQSSHPYIKNKSLELYLNTPIIVDGEYPDISYRDVAIIEPGDEGTSYPDFKFWDYVTIEGSVNGVDWKQLVTPYDANFNSNWTNIYNISGKPSKVNFITHKTRTTDFFNVGDEILIRFRLFSDAEAVGWGWIIDDLEIQKDPLGNDKYDLFKVDLSVYPNPVNSNSKVNLPEKMIGEKLKFELHDIGGRLINSGEFNSETEESILPFKVSGLRTGNYIFSVYTDEYFAREKLLKAN